MKISELFNRGSVYNSERAVDSQRAQNNSSETREDGKVASEGDDKVSISPIARHFRKVSQILSEDEKERQAKVDAIKAKVASGEYQPSSNDVAKAIVSFAKDSSL